MRGVVIFLLCLFCGLSFASFKRLEAAPAQSVAKNRSTLFDTPLAPQDAQTIRYIITTLGEKDVLALWGSQKDLETAGERVRHVHPLRFMAFVLKDPQLRSQFRRMASKGIVWRRFSGDMAASLANQARSGTINQQTVEAFCRDAQVNCQRILPYAQRQDWNGFMNALAH